MTKYFPAEYGLVVWTKRAIRPRRERGKVLGGAITCGVSLALLLGSTTSSAQTGHSARQTPAAPREEKKAQSPDPDAPMRRVPDPGVIPTNQAISPAGIQSVLQSRVYGISFGALSNQVYVATTPESHSSYKGTIVYKLDWQSNKVIDKLSRPDSSSGLQGLTYDPVSRLVLITGIDKNGDALVSRWRDGRQLSATTLGKSEIAQVAVSPTEAAGTRYAVVALTVNDQAAILDLQSGQILSKVKTGIAPFGAVIDASNTTAWVSNWGGRFPRSGDRTATTGIEPDADSVVVDARGVAASGTVSRIDLRTRTVIAQIEVGLHPASLALDGSRNRLYVANSNSDTISVIDTTRNAIAETIPLQPFARDVAGVSPESLVLSKDGRHLYVACAGINAVAVLELNGNHIGMKGLIPTGWYPDSIGLSPNGKYLGVATLLGVGSGWKNTPAGLCPHGPSRRCRWQSSYRGTIHIIPVPDAPELERYSIAVAANNRLRLKAPTSATGQAKTSPEQMPVPLRAGDPSPIKHVVYIIKENHTYDSFFGGLGKGNGDPELELYSNDVIPNHKKLARDFVLLDNFYASGDVSSNGHQWLTQATETDYTYLLGNSNGRSNPTLGDDPLAVARGAFIWNAISEAGKTFVDFGEYAGAGTVIGRWDQGFNQDGARERQLYLNEFRNGSEFVNRFSARAPVESLNPFLAKDYPGWTIGIPDVARARIFNRYLKQWEMQHDMPDLVMVQLPSDHTSGNMPNFSTPKACIADNDYAMGMIVDAVSHSKFWSSTLILVVEDDPGGQLDHVDGHRTVALAISPYTKRGFVDSTFYSHPSMPKTIELILGLKNLSMFDLIANDMRNSFQDKPDLTPYTLEVPRQSIFEVTPPLRALSGQARKDAEASLHMNFSIPDAAPAEKLSRILWRNAKGSTTTYPKVKRAIFAPYSNDLDDEEVEERPERR